MRLVAVRERINKFGIMPDPDVHRPQHPYILGRAVQNQIKCGGKYWGQHRIGPHAEQPRLLWSTSQQLMDPLRYWVLPQGQASELL